MEGNGKGEGRKVVGMGKGGEGIERGNKVKLGENPPPL